MAVPVLPVQDSVPGDRVIIPEPEPEPDLVTVKV